MVRDNKQFTEERIITMVEDAYRNGEASFKPDWNKAVLLVIDMLNEFVRPNGSPFWVPDATRMVPKLAELLESARKAGMPVIHTAMLQTNHSLAFSASGRFMPNRYPDVSYEDRSDDNDFVEGLKPLPNEVVIHKPSYGAFHDTPLDTILRNLGCTTVIITGTLTNLCCGTTARQAYERGYKVIFGSDATATNSREIHEAELKTLRYGFVKLMTAEKINEGILNLVLEKGKMGK